MCVLFSKIDILFFIVDFHFNGEKKKNALLFFFLLAIGSIRCKAFLKDTSNVRL